MKMNKYPGRINKSEARRRWQNNETFVIVPCKMSPYDYLGELTDSAYLVIPEIAKTIHRTFDIFFDSYVYYNCNGVSGMYPSYYLPKSERSL